MRLCVFIAVLLNGSKKALIPLAPSKLVCYFLVAAKPFILIGLVAGTTGLEPATSAVAVRPKH
jgi:hypothetical protein